MYGKLLLSLRQFRRALEDSLLGWDWVDAFLVYSPALVTPDGRPLIELVEAVADDLDGACRDVGRIAMPSRDMEFQEWDLIEYESPLVTAQAGKVTEVRAVLQLVSPSQEFDHLRQALVRAVNDLIDYFMYLEGEAPAVKPSEGQGTFAFALAEPSRRRSLGGRTIRPSERKAFIAYRRACEEFKQLGMPPDEGAIYRWVKDGNVEIDGETYEPPPTYRSFWDAVSRVIRLSETSEDLSDGDG